MRRAFLAALAVLAAAARGDPAPTGWTLVGWNDLGMHCTDGVDYAVFSLLPPFNNVRAQLVDPSGRLATDPSAVRVTYEAIADPDGSVNRTSRGKTNFWRHVGKLFGASPPPDMGLAGYAMPGPGNVPQPMAFDPAHGWFHADGIPITPYDDARRGNPYPMLRLVARDASGGELASTDVVVPVSDEMSCRSCHVPPAASLDPLGDMKRAILALHDSRRGTSPAYRAALAQAGYNTGGLAATVAQDGTPILCARCHGSNALPGTGLAGVTPLTQAMHGFHAASPDPETGVPLGSSGNRDACYRCHPGSRTRCLRGAMGSAVASDASLAIQCQSCHGSMADVGSAARQGWLDVPACQSCHTGTAAHNSGQIRYTTVFDAGGGVRVPADPTFATTPDVPAAGFSLYRLSHGHGNLACEACHGSTHAEYPSSHRNDNIQSLALEGHIGTIADCATCHAATPSTIDGGPHGMHPVGQDWVAAHPNAAENNASRCQACHGVDYRGTVLSRAFGDRTLNTRFGTKTFWKGFQVGCYTCHSGPSSENANPNAAPVVTDALAGTPYGTPLVLSLVASDANGDALELRIVRQPAHGAAGLAGRTVTYIPEPGFVGRDAFTFAASDGSTDSNLGTAAIDVAESLAPTPTPTPSVRQDILPVVPPPAPRSLTPRP